jgi:uncharacterized protein YcfJ
MHSSIRMPATTQAPNTNIRLFSMAASITPLLLLTLSFGAQARPYDSYARVTQVTPIYDTYTVREPYQECHLEKRIVEPRKHHHRNTSTTPTIVGALIGGAIGNELGHNKSNKRVGAVAGAILGGSIANDLTRQSRNHHPRHHHNSYATTERVCTTHYHVSHEKQVTAYDVNYKYQGQTYSTVMNTHPGRKIRVAVDVKPIGY